MRGPLARLRRGSVAPPPGLIVGVDFGTTYTGKAGFSHMTGIATDDFLGVSYVPSNGTARDIIVIQEWPGPSRITELVWKTPSRIAYATDVENEAILGGQNAIGYQVTAKMKSYTWFKLLLDHTQATKFDDPGLSTSEGVGVLKVPTDRTVREVVSDYLGEVYRHTMKYLENKMSAEILRLTTIEFWFTIPAIWSDAAKADTMNAARLAGFGSRSGDNINLIPEPEAAAISTLSGLTSDGSEVQVEVSMNCMLSLRYVLTIIKVRRQCSGLRLWRCVHMLRNINSSADDKAGGTVDITTYLIRKVNPHLEFEELLRGEGGKCGSTYIDRLFLGWMSSTFGPDFDNLPFVLRGPGSKFMKEFEMVKRDFGSNTRRDEIFEIPLAMRGVEESENYEPDEGNVRFSVYVLFHILKTNMFGSDVFFRADLKTFFQPVIRSILQLLADQLQLSQQETGHSINVGLSLCHD
jgi:hypothetical protein